MTLPAGAISLMKDINSNLGTDTVVLGSEMAVTGRFTTGSLSLDVALGGGWPANQWSEIIGEAMAGKTACVLKTVAANQKLDPEYVTFWLAGERYDEQQATALGVDNSRMIVASTQNMEEALSLLVYAADSKKATCIVLDSYPALIPAEEDEKSVGEVSVAVGARLFGKFLRKAGKASHRAIRGGEPSFHGLIINQFRDRIGGFSPFGTPQTTPGGKGKDYFFYARVEVKRTAYIEEKRPGIKVPVKVGQSIRFTTIKNKSAAPQQRAEVDYYFRGAPFSGFARGDYDTAKEFVEIGKVLGVISGSTWLNYGGEKFNGKGAMEARIREDVDFKAALREDIMEVARNPLMVDQVADEQYEEARK